MNDGKREVGQSSRKNLDLCESTYTKDVDSHKSKRARLDHDDNEVN